MQQKIETIGRIMFRSSEIESALRRRGATGAGIHELADSLPALPPEVVKLLHYIASVRNKAAHEGADAPDDHFDPEFFEEAAVAVLAELGAPAVAAPPAEKEKAPEKTPEKAPEKAPAPEEKEEEKKATKEKEETEEAPVPPPPPLDLASQLRRTAFVPGLHLFYPLWLIVRAFEEAAAPAIGILGSILAALGFATAAKLESTPWLYTALALLTASWLYGAISGFLRRQDEPCPKWLYYSPILNLGYFFYHLARQADKLLFLAALFMIGTIAAGAYIAIEHAEYEAALIAWLAEYLAGVLLALFQEKKRD